MSKFVMNRATLFLFTLLLFATLPAGCGRTSGNTLNGESNPLGQSESGTANQADESADVSESEISSNTAVEKTDGGKSDASDGNASQDGIPPRVGTTSEEAPALAWSKAEGNFGDAVLWRMIPTDDKDSTRMMLDADWRENDRSEAWFLWYADVDGENWMMFTVEGRELTHVDIGTRSFSVLQGVPPEWPRDRIPISMKGAAKIAESQGANLDALSWVELNCDYEAGEYRSRPVWMFACSETAESGNTLNYRVFVDALTGETAGALNDRNETMTLPIDLAALSKPKTVNHQADVETFFANIAQGDPSGAVRQMAYEICPDEATGQQWLANFQSLKSLEVVSVEQARLEEWTAEWETYKVTLKVELIDPSEQYGWETGQNMRWVTIVPQGAGTWKISALASNP